LDKLAFITGASSGIGQALAWRYHQAGWRLALAARRKDAIEAWMQDKNIPADRCTAYAVDVSDVDGTVAAGRDCIDKHGVPDTVIANAGVSIGMDTAYREDIDVMARLFATNNTGLAATFHPFIEGMTKRGSGRLVGMASVAGIRGLPGHGAYCASKAGVIAYCESLRGELRASGVKVVTILPGYIDTPLTQGNSYSMPFLMPAEDFARIAFDAIEAGASWKVIPWQMSIITKLMRAMPNFLYDITFANRPRKQRQQ